MIDLRYVKKLLEMLDESTVDSMEISSDKGLRIRLNKTPSARGVMQYAAAPARSSWFLSAALSCCPRWKVEVTC